MAAKVLSLSHVGITVKDFSQAVNWYWDVFRFPLIADMTMTSEELQKLKKLYNLDEGISVQLGFLRCPGGGVIEIFDFSEHSEREHRWNVPGPHHLTLDVKDVKSWHERLKARGDVEILCSPQQSNGSDWFFFKDPDGNLIELIDLKANYLAIRQLGKLVGYIMRKSKFKEYYN